MSIIKQVQTGIQNAANAVRNNTLTLEEMLDQLNPTQIMQVAKYMDSRLDGEFEPEILDWNRSATPQQKQATIWRTKQKIMCYFGFLDLSSLQALRKELTQMRNQSTLLTSSRTQLLK